MKSILSTIFVISLFAFTFSLMNTAFLKKINDRTYESSLIDSNEKSIDHVGGVDLSKLNWFNLKINAEVTKEIDPVTKNKNCDQYFSKWCALTCNFKFSKNQQYCSFDEKTEESTCCCAFFL